MRKFIHILATSCALFACSGLCSVEQEKPSRAELGPRQSTQKKKNASEKKDSQGSFQSKSAIYETRSFRPVYYLKDVGAKGKTLTTADETIWEISSRTAATAGRWQPNSPLIIQPNRNWFSTAEYYLYNVSTNEYVEADLSQGPFLKYSLLIQQINYYTGYVQLSNGTEWFVGRSQLAGIRFPSWQLNQAVLIGENTSWFGPKYILVNINENNYVPASQLR